MAAKAGRGTIRAYKAKETVDILGIEVFATGTHNGDTYDVADLEQMVGAAGKVGFEAPVKLGHMEDADTAALLKKEGMPAFGWVRNLRVQGKKLLADLMEVPKRLGELIQKGAYRRVSAEIYWNFQKGKDIFPRVLKAVSLLGAEIPAVTDLAGIEALYRKLGLEAHGKDEAGHEFRTYMGLDSSAWGGLQLKRKDDVAYRLSDGTLERCGTCRFYLGNAELGAVGACTLVQGEIAAEAICDLYEAREAFEFPGGVEEAEGEAARHRKKRPRAYTIEKRGDEWCLVAKGTGETLGCHPSREKAEEQEAAIKANMADGRPFLTRLTLDQVRKLCAPCAERMEFLNLRELKVAHDPATKRFQGFNQGLCDEFGDREGFRTRCMESSAAAEVDDPGAFCNALKEFCFGTTAEASQRAGAKGVGSADAQVAGGAAMPPTVEELQKENAGLKGQVTAFTAKITELEGKAAGADKANAKVAELEAQNVELGARVTRVETERADERDQAEVARLKGSGRLEPREEPGLMAALKLSRKSTETVTFSDNGKETKLTARDAILRPYRDRTASKRFEEVSLGEGADRREGVTGDPGKELEAKIAEYQAKNGGAGKMDYRTAYDEVLRANPELKARYARTPAQT